MTSPPDILAAAGRSLYGDRWLMRLARDLDISDDTLSRWMNGRTPLNASHGVFRDAERLLRARAIALLKAADDISALRDS